MKKFSKDTKLTLLLALWFLDKVVMLFLLWLMK